MKKTVEDYIKEGVKVFDEVPDGWIRLNATTQPKGYKWYSNGKSLFKGEYESGLVRKKE